MPWPFCLLFEGLITPVLSNSHWLQCSKLSPYLSKVLEDYFCMLWSVFHIHTTWSVSFLTIHQLIFNLNHFHFQIFSRENWCLLCYFILYLCNWLFLPNTLHFSLLNLILFFSDDLFNLSRPFGILILLSTCSESLISCHMQMYCV